MRYALIAAREAMDLTQQQLGDMIKLDRSSIAKYEWGRSDIPGKVLKQLSEILSLPMDVLYRTSDTPLETRHREILLRPQALRRVQQATQRLQHEVDELVLMHAGEEKKGA